MKKALVPTLSILVSLVLVGAACTRSATEPLPATATMPPPGELVFPTPLPTLNPLESAYATQTAVAQSFMQTLGPEQGGGEEGATPTPAFPAFAPASPTPQPTPTPRPRPIPTVEVPSSYVLQKGEYPYCIARRFNIDPDVLLQTNGLVRGQIVYPGTTLIIPQDAPPFPGERAWHPHPDTYVVQYGDTIYSIACYYGDITPEAIAAANGIDLDTPLTPGQTLQIP